MYIKNRGYDMKDVFLGKGWLNWVCYQQQADGSWKRIKGLEVDKHTDEKIRTRLNAWTSR